MKNFRLLALFLATSLVITSCSKDDAPTPVNEEELITTVKITLTGGVQPITLIYKDMDGDGPTLPTITPTGGATLVAGTTYTGTTTFLNELASPTEDITEEVSAEGADHQIFYELPATLGTITYDNLDVDENDNPIGLKFTLVAATSGVSGVTNNLIVTLRHEPNKSATGVAAGDITNAGGTTDARVTFPLKF